MANVNVALVRNIEPLLVGYVTLTAPGVEEGQPVERRYRLRDDLPADLMLESFLLQAILLAQPELVTFDDPAEAYQHLAEIREANEALHTWRAHLEAETLRIFGHIVRHTYPTLDDVEIASICPKAEDRVQVIMDFFSRRSQASSVASPTTSDELEAVEEEPTPTKTTRRRKIVVEESEE